MDFGGTTIGSLSSDSLMAVILVPESNLNLGRKGRTMQQNK